MYIMKNHSEKNDYDRSSVKHIFINNSKHIKSIDSLQYSDSTKNLISLK